MLNKSKLIIASVFLSTLMLEPAMAAGSMRCGSHIISAGGRSGPGMYEVLKKCGDPTERFGNTWIYNQSGGATRTVHFNTEGNVMRIE